MKKKIAILLSSLFLLTACSSAGATDLSVVELLEVCPQQLVCEDLMEMLR